MGSTRGTREKLKYPQSHPSSGKAFTTEAQSHREQVLLFLFFSVAPYLDSTAALANRSAATPKQSSRPKW